MSDTRGVIRATFYAGPADGGVLNLLEPIRQTLQFPLDIAEARALVAHADPGTLLVPNTVEATYGLHLDPTTGEPSRDPHGRVLYVYARPTEGEPTP